MQRRSFLRLAALGTAMGPQLIFANRDEKASRIKILEIPTISDTYVELSWVDTELKGTVLRVIDSDNLDLSDIKVPAAEYALKKIKGLSANTLYKFELLDGESNKILKKGQFKTLKSFKGEVLFRFGLINDIHIGEEYTGCFHWKFINVAKCYKQADGAHPYWAFCGNQAVAELNNAGIDFLILNGDVTTRDKPDDYKNALKIFSKLKVPIYYGRGNHDTPRCNNGTNNFKEYLQVPSDHSFTHKGVHFLLPDLIDRKDKEGKAAIYPENLEWLKGHLGENQDRPTLLFNHHPFVRLLNMKDWVDRNHPKIVLKTLAEMGNVQGIFCGHTHGAATSKINSKNGIITQVTTITPKEYPTGYMLVEVFEDGYRMTTHRLADESCLAWNYLTSFMGFGMASPYQLGELSDRNFNHTWV